MKNLSMRLFLLSALFCFFINPNFGQGKQLSDTLQTNVNNPTDNSQTVKKVRKNSIMINVTNPILISDRFQIIGYERVLPNNQSFTVNVGVFSIPKFGGNLADSLGLNTEYKDKGFHFSTDYRFYLKKENKYAAPRGVYLAPYYTFNHLSRENSWNIDSRVEEVYTELKLNIHTIGAELGYQFIFWDRVALDLILIGPGYGFYGVKAKVGTTLSQEDESIFFDKINEILADKIPGYDRVIDAGEFARKGTYNTKTIGFRYVIRLGYRF
jgi:hypothetical protein